MARALATVVVALLVGASALVVQASPASAAGTFVVAPWGSDTAPGTSSAPWRTIDHAFDELRAGDTLVVRGGTYRERVKFWSGALNPGTPSAPIRVVAAAGERPVVQGVLWLTGADHWIIDGLDVTWDPDTGRDNEHMVVFHGGTGWRLTGSELWGAKSYAALLVGKGASGFRIDGNRIHDTVATNDVNQDHLIYIDNGSEGSGIIERNRLWGSPNGRGVKLGPPALDKAGTSNITIRFNTFFDNRGPSNIQLSGSSSNNHIHGNLMVGVGRWSANITAWNLSGRDNRVHDNLGWDSTSVIDDDPGLVDAGGNLHRDPQLQTPDLTPGLTSARAFGHLAGASDAPAPAPAPTTSDPQRALVNALYQDFLGRAGSPSEVDVEVAKLRQGLPTVRVIDEFSSSDEWAGSLIDGYYRSTLGRSADPVGRANWLRVLASGMSPADVAARFYASDEYFRRSGGTPHAWITDLYAEILHRRPDPAGLRHWMQMHDRGVSRVRMAGYFHGSAESRATRVSALYRALLGRSADPTGMATWTRVLADGQDIRLARTLASSAEYAGRAVRRFG